MLLGRSSQLSVPDLGNKSIMNDHAGRHHNDTHQVSANASKKTGQIDLIFVRSANAPVLAGIVVRGHSSGSTKQWTRLKYP